MAIKPKNVGSINNDVTAVSIKIADKASRSCIAKTVLIRIPEMNKTPVSRGMLPLLVFRYEV